MDFRLNDEQQQIQETARDFFESQGLTEPARRVIDGETEVMSELWEEMGDLDYTAMTVPLDHGGLGEGMVYLTALLEEAGRAVMPAPYPETMAAAVPLLEALGREDQKEDALPAVARGDRSYTLALYEPGNKPLPEAIQAEVEVENDRYQLAGSKTLVPYARTADRMIVAARSQDGPGYEGVTLFVVDPGQLELEPVGSLDQTRPLYRCSLDGVSLPEEARLGDLHEGGSVLRRAIDNLRMAYSAMTVGAADRAVQLSVDYGNERTQFGQPVGRFQAVKHRIVDMWMDLQKARSLVYYAAWALDQDTDDARRAVSAAKSFCSEQCLDIFEADILNHGGMGYTWDHDAHLYLKQAKSWQNYLGDPVSHRERIADERGL